MANASNVRDQAGVSATIGVTDNPVFTILNGLLGAVWRACAQHQTHIAGRVFILRKPPFARDPARCVTGGSFSRSLPLYGRGEGLGSAKHGDVRGADA